MLMQNDENDDEKLNQLAASLRSELQAIGFAGLTDERRSIRVPVYFTPSEKAKLDEVCAGMGISKFMRSLLLRSRPPSSRPLIPQVNREIYIELSRLGRNINQQTRALHEALQAVPSSPALDVLDASIVPAYLAQLEALMLLLQQVRQALVPLKHEEDQAEHDDG